MEFIGTKISNDLVHIKYENVERQYSAVIKCPYCSENITVAQMLNQWNTWNFDSHLTAVHKKGNKNFIEFVQN